MVIETMERTEQAEADASTFTLDADTFVATVDQCLVAVARHDPRPVLTGIYVKATGSAIEFVATDGFQLVEVTVPVTRTGADWSATIDAKAIKDALAAVKAADKVTPRAPRFRGAGADTRKHVPVTVTLAANRQSVTLAAGATTVALPLIQGTFPNYKNLIPTCDYGGGKVALNAGMVSALLARIGKYVDSGVVRMRVQSPSAPIRFDWREEDKWHGTAVVMPMFVQW